VECTIQEDPRRSVNWRRHRQGCPHYRERWFAESDPDAGEPLYQVFCSMDTPPATLEEQEKCRSSRTQCWRVVEARRTAILAGHDAPVDIPLATIKRRRPA
jgi:hypothetical protein